MTTPSKASDRCPACQSKELHSFYRVMEIPSHSVLLMDSRQEAIDYPRGDLELVHCAACGFVSNRLFDPALNAYSQHCEESQHFSGTFDRFAQSLAEDLVQRYDIRNKTVLEIGCGKADFLTQLCQTGDNQGIGVDPACRPDRLTQAAHARIRLLPELYGPQHAEYPADVICCRHTMEHIGSVDEFLSQVRRLHAHEPGKLVFIEVPDTTRVLRECAFWDIYYEHCSYFTVGSLSRLFQRHGFEVLDAHLAYGGQYILLTAVSAGGAEHAFQVDPADLLASTANVADFERRVPAEIERWRDRVKRLHQAGRHPVLWGGGSKAVAFLTTTGLDREIACAVDINPYKQGKFLPGTGHPVIGPDELVRYDTRAVIVMNPVYRDEIHDSLCAREIDAELVLLS